MKQAYKSHLRNRDGLLKTKEEKELSNIKQTPNGVTKVSGQQNQWSLTSSAWLCIHQKSDVVSFQ